MRTYRNNRRRLARRTAVAATLLWLVTAGVNRSLVRVAGPSMEPTLWPGDVLLTVPAALLRPRRGRVVVVEDPGSPGHQVIKRVRSVDDTGIDVRGDAPDRSTDSRRWGRLPPSAVRRVVVARWPDLRTPLRRPAP
jgi:nickel-type superoxide dismutase maturation protease